MPPPVPIPDDTPDALLRRLVTAAPLGFYAGTLRPGSSETLAANGFLRVMFGYAGDAPLSEIRPFDPDRFADTVSRDALIDRLGRDGTVRDLLLRVRRTDGALVWVEVTGHGDPDASGGTVTFTGMVRDVTERKRLDDQTRDLHQQLLQAEKLAALGQTISGVAHELNNPLATILTSSERLADKPMDPELRRAFETILGEAERAAKIVRNLLMFARKRNTTRTLVDLNQVVRETAALRAYEQRLNSISTIEALAAGLPPVFADPHQLQQVLLNLIINAEQAMVSAHGRGTLVLRSWQDPERDVVLLEVNDDGPGVSGDAMPRIFDPFFTTKHVGQGTGLGLTVAYAIVQEHGGRIRVESRPGEGASFVIELPTSGTGVRAAPRRTTPAASDVGGGASVLLVDDEPRLAAAVADALKDAGFQVDQAHDGADALEHVRVKEYDLIVCDLRMPRVDGPAFYRAIAASSPSLVRRLIFVTGDVAGTDAGRFLEESGCRWLTKPFRLADLLRLAREVLG
jgi:two-component system NtrC family sensor kinase